MRNPRTRNLLLVGLALVLLGFVLPLLMVMDVIQPTFLLSFIAYGTSTLGLLMGIIGAALWGIENKYRHEREE